MENPRDLETVSANLTSATIQTDEYARENIDYNMTHEMCTSNTSNVPLQSDVLDAKITTQKVTHEKSDEDGLSSLPDVSSDKMKAEFGEEESVSSREAEKDLFDSNEEIIYCLEEENISYLEEERLSGEADESTFNDINLSAYGIEEDSLSDGEHGLYDWNPGEWNTYGSSGESVFGGEYENTSGGEEESTSGGEEESTSGGEEESTSGGGEESTCGGEGKSTSGGGEERTSSGGEESTCGGEEDNTFGGEENTSCGEEKVTSDREEDCISGIEKVGISLPSEQNKCASNGDNTSCIHEITPLKDIFIDSEDFIRIVDSAAFIDKTLLIKKLFYKPSYKYMKTLLITAPHQSGKSVNMNMVKRFLEMEVNEIGKQKVSVKWDSIKKMWLEKNDMTENFKFFKERNFKIYQCQCEPKHTEDEIKMGMCHCRQFFYKHCGQHPVVFLSFHGLDCHTWGDLLSSYRSLLIKVFRQFRYLEYSEKLSYYDIVDFKYFFAGRDSLDLSEQQLCDGLELLVSCLHQHFGKKPVLLIDHFNAPLIELMRIKKQGYMVDRELKIIKKIVTSVIQGNENLLGGLINATEELSTNLSEHEINIKKYAFPKSQDFSDFYGFTKQEINELLQRPEFKEFTRKKFLEYCNDSSVTDNFNVYSVYILIKYLQNWME